MKRRDFILANLGLAVAGSFSALAQSTERMRLIGVVNVLSLDDPEAQIRLKIFKNALEQLGWEQGRNLEFEIRQIGRDIDRIHRYAAEIVALAPDVILTIGSIAVGALQQETRSIPIVFVNAPDPVGWFCAEHGPPRSQYHGLLEF